ncbi:MAG: glycerol-3-phosphate 1-O-acyltransferase PlsY [Armatimonadaceae bacterium]
MPASLPYFLIAFVVGSLPFGFWAGRLRGIDIRDHGSGNIGATNVLRVLGPAWGYPVLALDALKGWFPVFLAARAEITSWEVVAVGLFAVLGHIYSPLVQFRGGKGVATALGVSIGFSPLVAGLAFAVFILTVTLTCYVSLGSVLASLVAAAGFFLIPPHLLSGDPLPYRIFGLLVAIFIVYRHKGNMERIRSGTESRFGERKPPGSQS